MSRPQKQTVDYFPHDCVQGKTLFIIQRLFSNDGYAVLFKLLELLGQTEGHYLNIRSEDAAEYLWAYLDVIPKKGNQILDKLSALEFIDAELWNGRVIWCQNFINNLTDVYSRRVVLVPDKPPLDVILQQESRLNGINGDKNPQSKVN